ncbi:MAG: diaminobutyrate--2-oxoglutarate transaminase [Pseudomonadota bacterium]
MLKNQLDLSDESNVRSYCRAFPVVFDQAENAFMWDSDGNRYIDFLAGAGALNFGHNHPAMLEALITYLRDNRIVHSLDLSTAAKQHFLRTFKNKILSPKQLHYKIMFTGPTGANSVEAAIKLAKKATGRQRIAAFTNGYHGVTTGALALTGSRHHRSSLRAGLHNVDRYAYDGYFGADVDTIQLIERCLRDPSSGLEPPAAFILETIQGEGGLNKVSKQWIQRLSALAEQFGSLLIIDDIQAGCGRTGSFFSFEEFGIVPDLICLSKSISGFGSPMSLLLIKPSLDVWKPGEHNGTFRGNNLAFVTATVAVDLWDDTSFQRAVQRKGQLMAEHLRNIVHRYEGQCELRGLGMFFGLAFQSASIATKVSHEAFELGLIVETCGPNGEVVKCMPPLTIDDATLLEGLQVLQQSVDRVAQYYIKKTTSLSDAAE